MDDLLINIKKYLDGKIQVNAIMRQLYKICNEVARDVSGCGTEAVSFQQSAYKQIEFLEDASLEDNNLRFNAIICDIMNNLSHSLKEKNKVKLTQDSMNMERQLKGLKKGMAIQIIKECRSIGNEAYGLKEEAFYVDIPMCGQISWHFPYYCGLVAKEYEFEKERKTIYVTNQKLLCEGLKRWELDKFSERMRIVVESQDIDEMQRRLYKKEDLGCRLSEKVNPPSEIDLTFEEEKRSNELDKKSLSI